MPPPLLHNTYWRQRSSLTSFRAGVVKAGKSHVVSVGATHTITVAEGTHEGIDTPWQRMSQLRSKQPATTDLLDGDATFDGVTADPREGEQWSHTQIKSDWANQLPDGSRNILVGVLDSGIDPTHPDLQANIDVASSVNSVSSANSVNCTEAGCPDTSPAGWFPTTSSLGTHVAGIIGAPRSGIGITG